MKLKYLMFILFLMAFNSKAICQQFFITGRLISEGNQPVGSATIILKQSKQKTKSKSDGSFSLKFDGLTDTLLITHIGYKIKSMPVNISTKFTLTILLDRIEHTLDEVVVSTGYQQLPKERATGSFTQIDNATFNEQVSSDIMSRLPAIGNGLSEGLKTNTGNYSSPGKILIRGLSTINGPSSPLIILDNFPFEGDLQNINPNDVESITLLKDAAAASIWGARAGNGVIVITTKKGKFNQKIKIEFNTNFKITQKPNLFYDQTISSSNLIDVEEFLFSKGYRFSDTLSSSHPPYSTVYEILFRQRNGEISATEAANQINTLRNHDVRDDFNKYIYNPAISQQYAINMRGGANNINWLIAGGVDKNKDVLSAGFSRINFRIDNTIRLNNKIQFNTSLYFIESTDKSGKEGFGNIKPKLQNLPAYYQFFDANGNPASLAKEYRKGYTDTIGLGKILNWNYYPLNDYLHDRRTSKTQNIVGNISVSYEIFKGLSANLKYQYRKQTLVVRDLKDVESYYARNLINTFYQQSATDNFPIPIGGILTITNKSILSNNLRAQFNFNKVWKTHEVVAITGIETRQVKSENNSNRMYGYNDENFTNVDVDMVNSFKSLVTGSAIRIPNFNEIGATLNNFVSLFGNASYTFQKIYTISLSGRRDASNIFGVNTNDKWNPLWSVGASWLISNERFFRSSFLNRLNLRTTYGVSGNIDPALSALTVLNYTGSSVYTYSPIAQISKFYNPDLRWEKSRQLNIAMDFSLINSRLTGSIDFYIKKGVDLYGPSALDQTAGLGRGYIQKNAANMQAKGIDLVLNSLNINRKLKWITNLNANIYKDKITSYYLTSNNASSFISNGNNLSGLVGKPVYSVFSYQWGGLDSQNGDPQGFLDGKLSKNYASIIGSGTSLADLIYSGPGMPTLYGSLGNTFSYNGFSLSVRVTYKFGYYFRKPSIYYSSLFSALGGSSDFAKRWQKSGDEKLTNVPSMIFPAERARDQFYINSESLIEKGDNIRLQYITLSYEISKQKFSKLPFDKIQFYLNANDMGIVWRANKLGIDPDYSTVSIPFSKNIAVGTRINF